MMVNFNPDVQQKLRVAGYELPFYRAAEFHKDFYIEHPCVVQAQVSPDQPFSVGAFTGSYGGRLANITIGRYCSLAGEIQTGWAEHPTDWVSSSMVGYVHDIHAWGTLTRGVPKRPPLQFQHPDGLTQIGHDVWIGHGAFIKCGMKIGSGAIIAARSVVTSDVPPYAIVGGIPAKVIRYRFSDKIISDLLNLQWWRFHLYDLPMEHLRQPNRFIESVRTLIDSGSIQEYSPGSKSPAELVALVS